ncbi:DUF2561 family protein [Mycobacterium xenopi]|uniref:Transmembrane protein n=1 Tax=Mycobacterium xenopi TaxID=1789 RepID=A0AAD1H0R8_MYCXE|nr:DUF2561 family protein [Mycobacterium xenopi]ORX20938.1 hypothetical protein AWC32_02830 [Mycobacterium xenopi]BBU22361.1 hypothetical protein MYXE_21510 [Mycobacterium xenopi]SPX78238.1 Conserved membrane protein of uncharacterised function [Mycobacterium xenopi]
MGVDDPGDRQRWGTVSPVTTDRILLGVCVAVWLAVVGVSVAAVVALVDLGRGFQRTASQHTPAVLYAVIIVSALVIVAAIPALLRARRTGYVHPAGRPTTGPRVREAVRRPGRPGYVAPRTIAEEARTERLTSLAAAGVSGAEMDRIWLRGTLALAATMGVALIAVAAATYLMAIGRYGPSWTAYGIAGIVTATLPLISWQRVRRLRRLLTRV